MQFIFPTFLWALLALAIPIIIHLFHFRRFKKIYFPNVRFLKEVKEETSARSRLKNLLVLLMRLLAVTFLVLAFAQPFLPKDKEIRQGKKAVSIYVDNSFSMEALSEDVPLLERAKQRAREIIQVYGAEDRFQILTNDFEGKHQRLVGKEEALSFIDDINISPSVNKLDKVLVRQIQVVDVENIDNPIIYQISDFQKNITEGLFSWQDTSAQINLIPLQAVQEKNISIDSTWFVAPVQIINQTGALVVKVRNWSNEPAESVRLSINYAGQTKPVGTLTIPANGFVVDTTPITALGIGWQEAELQITDYPITFDDRYYLTFKVATQINMLAINESGVSNRYLNAAFAGLPYFKLDNQNNQNLNYAQFSDYQLIILNDLQNISSGLTAALKQYVSNGGNLLIFPSASANVNTFNDFLRAFPANELQRFDNQVKTVGSLNTSEFVFNDVFEKMDANLKLPSTQGNYTLTSYGSRKQETLMAYREGSPFLVKNQIGDGNLYLCAAPLSEQYSDLVRNGEIFIPMIFKMAIAAGQAPRIAYTIGQDDVLEAKHIISEKEQVYKLKSEQEEVIPEQRVVGSKVFLSVNNQIKSAGYYRLSLKEDEILHQYAFNYDRKESALNYYNEQDLAQRVGKNITVIGATAKANFEQLLTERSQGVVLWRWCLILALLFLGLEVLLLRFLKG